MQLQNGLMFTPSYDVELVRNGKILRLTTLGISAKNYPKQLIYNDVATKMNGDIGYYSALVCKVLSVQLVFDGMRFVQSSCFQKFP